MQAHSSPLSLAARLPQCCANNSHYINNGWTFSGQTLSIKQISTGQLGLNFTWELWETTYNIPQSYVNQDVGYGIQSVTG